MYVELSVIVEGALEIEEIFHDETLMRERINEIRSDAEGDGYRVEVFLLWHDHEDLAGGEECFCVQYLTDHRPAVTFNPDGPGTSAVGAWS